MKLVRNMKTEVVHRPGCSSRGTRAMPWLYATCLTLDEVRAETVAYPWLHLCRICIPKVCQCGKCRPAEPAEVASA